MTAVVMVSEAWRRARRVTAGRIDRQPIRFGIDVPILRTRQSLPNISKKVPDTFFGLLPGSKFSLVMLPSWA